MKLAEAIIKSLEYFEKPTNANDIGNYLIKKQLWDTKGATPLATIQARLGDFIRENDNRVSRIKDNGVYFYYLAKNEQGIDTIFNQNIGTDQNGNKKHKKVIETYHERDLHTLLTTYLKNENIYSKTIYHEESNRKDENQKWTHPDMIGIRFLYLKSTAGQKLFKAIDKTERFKFFSYEVKREINNDYELKKAYFQTVSNSSWANYGYLVAFEISDNLKEEIERLNQSFGIGVILLNANPFQSKILFQARHKNIDFKTVDKLCIINEEFKKFIDQTEKLLTTEERYYKSTEKELDEFCDRYLKTDTEIEIYCKAKHIPLELDEE